MVKELKTEEKKEEAEEKSITPVKTAPPKSMIIKFMDLEPYEGKMNMEWQLFKNEKTFYETILLSERIERPRLPKCYFTFASKKNNVNCDHFVVSRSLPKIGSERETTK